MKIYFLRSFFLILLLAAAARVDGSCGDTQNSNGDETYTGNTCQTTFTKTVHWKVYWLDGYERDVNVADSGTGSNIFGFCSGCWPGFNSPAFSEEGTTAYWDQPTTSGSWNGNGDCAQSGTHFPSARTHVSNARHMLR